MGIFNKIKSEDEINNQLIGRNIVKIGKYVGNRIKISWLCGICDCKWDASPLNVLNKKSGCPRCSKNEKFNNSIFDDILKEKNINRIGQVINSRSKIKVKCNICDFEWLCTPFKIKQGGGCLRCLKKEKINNDIFDNRIIYKKILRIDNIINVKTKIKFLCLICNNIWEAIPSNIMRGVGCPICAKEKTRKSVNEKLIKIYLKDIFSIDSKTKQIVAKDCETRKNIFVDYYFEFSNKNIIIEYNGPHHYEPTIYHNKMTMDKAILKFESQAKRDKWLRNYCKESNIYLIEIDGRKYKGEKIKSYLESEFNKIGIL